MINHEPHERWRRIISAGLCRRRCPATRCVFALRRGAQRQASLWETRFPRDVCLGLAGPLGFVVGSAYSVLDRKRGLWHNATKPFSNGGCFGLVGQAGLKRRDRSSPHRQGQPDWNGGRTTKNNHPKGATAFVSL